MCIYLYACIYKIWCIVTTVVLFTRFMIKRAQGRKRFGMKNFKKRWFRLTNHEFTYQKSKGNKVLPVFFWYIKVKIKQGSCKNRRLRTRSVTVEGTVQASLSAFMFLPFF